MDQDEVSRKILTDAQTGDHRAFGLIVERYKDRVYTIARRMTHNGADADDLAQEIFLRVYRGLKTYDPNAPFEPWLRTVAANTGLNFLKSRRRVPTPAEIAEEAVAREVPVRSRNEAIEKAIARLPEEQRVAIAMKYFGDAPVEEIAAALDVPVGTAKVWLFRARNTLKAWLTGERQ